MEAIIKFSQGFALFDIGLAIVFLFGLRLLGKPLPFEASIKAWLARRVH